MWWRSECERWENQSGKLKLKVLIGTRGDIPSPPTPDKSRLGDVRVSPLVLRFAEQRLGGQSIYSGPFGVTSGHGTKVRVKQQTFGVAASHVGKRMPMQNKNASCHVDTFLFLEMAAFAKAPCKRAHTAKMVRTWLHKCCFNNVFQVESKGQLVSC